MLKSVKYFLGMTIIATLFIFPLISGCKGTDSREKVDDTVETLAGKKQVDQMKKMEKDISDIADRQVKRLDELEESDSDEKE